MNCPEPITRLIENYMKLPGISQETATRLAFYTIDMKEGDANAFTKALISIRRDLHFCSIYGNITEEDPYEIHQNKSRDHSITLVVEESKDVMAMEKMREYQSLYHVPHGVLSSMKGAGPEDINIASLIKRLHDDEVKEIIVATNTTTEGEAVTMYLSRLTKPVGITITRLVYGLSVDNDIGYADEIVLPRAVEGRQEI